MEENMEEEEEEEEEEENEEMGTRTKITMEKRK